MDGLWDIKLWGIALFVAMAMGISGKKRPDVMLRDDDWPEQLGALMYRAVFLAFALWSFKEWRW